MISVHGRKSVKKIGILDGWTVGTTFDEGGGDVTVSHLTRNIVNRITYARHSSHITCITYSRHSSHITRITYARHNSHIDAGGGKAGRQAGRQAGRCLFSNGDILYLDLDP